MITIQEAKSLLKIDKNDLDEECIKHSDIYLEVGQMCAEAISRRDEKKELKEEAWAKEFIGIKSNTKVSDQQAKSMADYSDNYKEALREFLDAKKEAEEWIVIKEAWTARAAMLKYLCELYISGFYGVNVKVKSDKYEEIKEKINKERKAYDNQSF